MGKNDCITMLVRLGDATQANSVDKRDTLTINDTEQVTPTNNELALKISFPEREWQVPTRYTIHDLTSARSDDDPSPNQLLRKSDAQKGQNAMKRKFKQ